MNRRASAAAMPTESTLQVAVRVLAPVAVIPALVALVVVVLLISPFTGAGST